MQARSREGKTAPLLRPDAAFQPPCPRRGAACSESEPLTDRIGKFPPTPSAGGNPPGGSGCSPAGDGRYLLPSRWSRQAGGWRWCGRETKSRSPTWQCTEPTGLNKIFTESLEISDSYFFHLKQEALPNPLRGELWGLEEAELYIHKGDFCCLEGRRLRRPSCLVETGVRTKQPEHNRAEIPEASRSDADATPGACSALCGRQRALTRGSGHTGGLLHAADRSEPRGGSRNPR